MARQPVQLPSRGGANSAGVGNRAQYLRPAKDTQNSRALASAFSQMNRAFGRIAANEQRIANQKMADELQQAEEEQKLLEQRALLAGQMSALTGEDQAALYASNPAAMQSYYEGAVQSEMSQGLMGIANDFRSQPFFGDPMQQEMARQFLTDAYSEAFQGVDPLMVGNMLPQINSQFVSLLKENDNQVFQNAQIETTRQMTNSLHSSMVNGDSNAFMAEVEGQMHNAYLDMGGSTGNKISVDALDGAIRDAASDTDEDYLRAAENFSNLLANKEFMNGLTPAQREQLETAFDAANRKYDQRKSREAAQAEAELNLEIAKLDDKLIFAYLSGNQNELNILRKQYLSIDPTVKTWANRYDSIIDNLSEGQNNYLNGSDIAAVAQSAQNLSLMKHYLDAKNLTRTNPEWVKYVIDKQGQLTKSDHEKLLAYDPSVTVEAFNHQAYKSVSKHLNALGDLFADNLPEGSEQLKRLIEDLEIIGFEKQSVFRRSMQSSIDSYLRDNQESYPASYDAQRNVINDAVNFALNEFLDGTAVDGVNLIDSLRDEFGVLPPEISTSPVFKAYFQDTGYEQKYQESLKIKNEFEAAAIESLPRGVVVADDVDTTRFTFNPMTERAGQLVRPEDTDGDGISDERESLLDGDEPVNPMTNRAGSRQRVGSNITRERLGITRIDRRRQDDGSTVPASIRTFNFGAIGNVTRAAGKKNFEKAFAGKTLGDQDLPGLDGSDVPTTAFKTVEDGIRYFGWWMAYRGNPGSITELSNKYYTDSNDAAEWASKVSQYSGLDLDEEITSDNMSALANGVFSHEAGPSAWTSTNIGTTVDMVALIEEGKQLYEDNK